MTSKTSSKKVTPKTLKSQPSNATSATQQMSSHPSITSQASSHQTPEVISDYNGYDYKKIFWEDADRKYEDMADRLAIRKLLPERDYSNYGYYK